MFKKLYPKTALLCFMPNGKLVCYQSGDIIVLEGENVLNRFHLFSTFKERILGRNRLLTRLLRLGVRAAIAIDSKKILLSIGNIIYELDICNGKLSNGYYCGDGIRPLIFTEVKGIEGFEDGIYFGGYLGNMGKKPVSIYHRVGVDEWHEVYAFPQGTINHVHNVVADQYRQCLWLFTGDFDEAAAIWKVTDGFKNVEQVACNDQKYRGCVAFALPEGLLYAMDAPFEDDYIYLLTEEEIKGLNGSKRLEVQEMFPIEGSCIYGCQWKERYVFSSTVEGDGRKNTRWQFYFSRKRGTGIKDKYVHMYEVRIRDSSFTVQDIQGFKGSRQIGDNVFTCKEIYKEEKDWLPLYTFQFGVFKFPYGRNNTDTLYFQPIAVKTNDQFVMCLK